MIFFWPFQRDMRMFLWIFCMPSRNSCLQYYRIFIWNHRTQLKAKHFYDALSPKCGVAYAHTSFGNKVNFWPMKPIYWWRSYIMGSLYILYYSNIEDLDIHSSTLIYTKTHHLSDVKKSIQNIYVCSACDAN